MLFVPKSSALLDTFEKNKGNLNFSIRDKLFVAICASSLTLESYFLFGSLIDTSAILIVFFSTLFIYTFHRLIKMIRSQHFSDIKPKELMHSLFLTCIICLIALFYLFINAAENIQLLLIGAGVFAVWYSVGFIRFNGDMFNLRSLSYVKLFLIALIWSVMTVGLPLLANFFSQKFWLIFLERYFFILAITIPFDIRDMALDKKEGIKTIPLLMGEKRSILLAKCILLVFMAFSSAGYLMDFHSLSETLALILSAAVSWILVSGTRADRKPGYFTFYMEGMSLLQSVLILISTLFHF